MEGIITIIVSLAVGITLGYFLFGRRKEAPVAGTILAHWNPSDEQPSLIMELEPDGLERMKHSRTVLFRVQMD